MRIQRIETKQGHPVPKSAHHPRGPFPPELMRKPEVITEYVPADEEIPEGGTSQNNFVQPKMFKCKLCSGYVYEHQIPDHLCGELNDGEDS